MANQHQQSQFSMVYIKDSSGKKQVLQPSQGYKIIKKESFTNQQFVQKGYSTSDNSVQQGSTSEMEFTGIHSSPYMKNVKIENDKAVQEGQSTRTNTRPNHKTNYSPRRSTTSSVISSAQLVHKSLPSNGLKKSAADKKKSEKVGKGLRHFSMKVCQKVKEKGVTSYNEVADELVAEESDDATPQLNGSTYDQKNIRRRVYDALNVLMAMNIISKEKKEIKWIGLPTTSAQECEVIELENQEARKRIEEKQQQLRELILKHISFKSLIERNKEMERRGVVPTLSSTVQLPFIIINTNKKTHINCNISNDKREYLLKFEDKFEVHDDVEVLKRMGLLFGLDKGETKYENIEKLKKLVPKPFQKYIEMYGNGVGAEYNLIEEDWMDSTNQSSCSSTQISTHLDTDDIIKEDQLTDDGI